MKKDRIDLTRYLINKDKPNGGDNSSMWWAGEQLEALRFYLNDKVKIIGTYQEEDYQGDCYAYLKVGKIHVLWRDSFGSCSGCDGLEDENGYEYIKSTLQEGNTKQFASEKEMLNWLLKTNDYFWKKLSPENLNIIKKKEAGK